ncbi:glycosyltransferase [Gluconacetobacter entanii]|uniref:Glycosyltransferase n=1 Tax=Gluconacetobacter entanii TaxID=108528 RepID=A0ABT3K722_9PROT|nr:glycosyltransferase [Gluconacetobacter entanii]MCW4591227.1 glycosyltransferase [Gluconacetobacter entanii]MCW4595469.1 glycosyltransferase [Gluconacetobacter entanii]NPC88551.1 glycosyltransferase [Gluconacetobacter entanii]
MPTQTAPPLRAFVQLSYGYGARSWHARWQKGEIPGINEPYAYGYYRAAGPDVIVEQSEDRAENPFSRLVRYGVRFILGFDFVQAWRNRAGILSADVVWTHTEAQALAVLLLYRLTPRRTHPPLIAQSVWLMDRWPHEPAWRRLFMRSLLSRADMLTFLSPENLAQARTVFPGQRMEWIPFGIRADDMTDHPPPVRTSGDPVRVLSLGNDRHRDWSTLMAATSPLPDGVACHVTIATANRFVPPPHVTRVTPTHNDMLFRLYDEADLVVVPLTHNLHASGITVIEEATLRGLPVIATDTGGLRHYFGEDCVFYVPVGDAQAMGHAIVTLACDPDRCTAMVSNARERMRTELNSRSYALRHVALSRELVSQRSPAAREAGDNGPAAARDMKITVGIATCGRPGILRETIAELRRQTHPPHRIIVCAPTLQDMAGLDAADGLVLLQGPRGLAHQRNMLLQHMEDADIVVFFDDDFLPDPDYLAQCAMAFASDPEIVVATGRVLADGAKGPGLTVEDARTMLADPAINDTPPLPAVQTAWNGYGCNMAYRLSTIAEMGVHFDERLPLYAWYEDIDFSRQLGRRGRIVRVNGAKGIHLGSKSGRTPGRRLGYSQVANPLYLSRKGTFPLDHALRSIGRNMAMNAIRSLWPEPYIDRRGRIIGNWLALRDALLGRISPEKMLTL